MTTIEHGRASTVSSTTAYVIPFREIASSDVGTVGGKIPNNVVLATQFSELFDGFSIGSNDLTQLTLGVDRDSEQLAHVFDERDPGVKAMIEMVVQKAHASGRKVGICGEAPSNYPDFAAWLAGIGIDSMSLNPDALPGVARTLAKRTGA